MKVFPLLKDGTTDKKHLEVEPEKSVCQLRKQSAIGSQFVSANHKELKTLFNLIQLLKSHGFYNALNECNDRKLSA